MQAYRLRVADRHHTQVVKVCVEPRSNCAAFVLADSSALLVSLSSLPAIARTSIPTPCTDACFLRLQARVLAGSGSSLLSRPYAVDRGASGGIPTSGGESREQNAKLGEAGGGETGKGTPRVGLRVRGGSSKLAANGNGKGVAGNIRSRVYFLTSQPAKGGSCIDVFAWHCEPPSFSPANVEIDRPTRSSKGPESGGLDHDLQGRLATKGRAARLEIPHGMMMKMVASINVVIVYSIAAGKIWVLAAKHVGPPELPKDQGGRSFRGTGLSPVEKDLDTGLSSKRAASGRDGGSYGHLLLMKCAVLECNRPVYSLYVSSQHLLLGEAGGVWIWPLRPLIKPDQRLKERERPKNLTLRSENSHLLATCSSKVQLDTTFEDPACFCVGEPYGERIAWIGASGYKAEVSNGKAAKNGRQLVEDQQLDSLTAATEISKLDSVPKNGLYTFKGDEKEQVRRVCEGIRTCGVPRKNGFHEEEKNVCLVVNTKCFGNGYISQLDSVRTDTLSEVKADQQDGKGQAAGDSVGGLPLTLGISSKRDNQKPLNVAPNHVGTAVQEDLQTGDRHFREEADLLGKRAIMESLWKAGVVQKRNGVVLLNGNGHEPLYIVEGSQSYSSGSDGVGSLETNTPFEVSHLSVEKPLDRVKQQQGLGLIGPIFVTTSKERQQDGFMAGKGVLQAQVVDIQEISSRRFVVLDSCGDLHLLALEDVQDRGTNSPLSVSHPKMTPLKTSIKVSSMAVLLPALQSTSLEAKRGVVRKIWISDGHYSNYVAIIPSESSEEICSEARIANTGRKAALHVEVAQTIFTSERVATIAAVSAETVLVVTQGSVIAYVMSGS